MNTSLYIFFLCVAIFLQPLNKVRALHLSAVLHQALGTPSALDAALMAYSQALSTLCSLVDVPHADMLLNYSSQILLKYDAGPEARVQFLLSKSQYLLITGKVMKTVFHLPPLQTFVCFFVLFCFTYLRILVTQSFRWGGKTA